MDSSGLKVVIGRLERRARCLAAGRHERFDCGGHSKLVQFVRAFGQRRLALLFDRPAHRRVLGIDVRLSSVMNVYGHRLMHIKLVARCLELAHSIPFVFLFVCPELVRTTASRRSTGRRNHIHERRTRQFRQELLTASLNFTLAIALDLGVLSGRIQLRSDARKAVLIAIHIMEHVYRWITAFFGIRIRVRSRAASLHCRLIIVLFVIEFFAESLCGRW